MEPNFGWSLDTCFICEGQYFFNYAPRTSHPKVIWDVTKPNQKKFRFLAGPRNTHLNNDYQRFSCPSKFGKNWLSVQLPIIWYLSELILLTVCTF